MADSNALRKHLLYLLGGGGAHVDFDSAIAGWPAKLRGSKPKGLPHTAWQLLEHMRIAQWDILEFSRNSETRLAQMARGLLAGNGCPTQPRRMEQERQHLSG